jgi:hypothetical protein
MIKNKEKFRYIKFINYIRKQYNSGCLIRDDSWKAINDMAQIMDKLEARSKGLKKQALVETFLGQEIEDFIVLTHSYNTLFTSLINVSDYLKKKLGHDIMEEDVIFETDEEALDYLEKAFIDIEQIKEDNDVYFNKGLRDE